MHFSSALVVFIGAGLAAAQTLPNIPACAFSCFATALTTDGCTSLTDFACHCQKPQLVSEVTPCVQQHCDVAQQSSVSSIVVSQCSAAGHPISVPPVGAAAATTASAAGGSMTSTATYTTTMSGGACGSSPMASSSPAPMSPVSTAPMGTGSMTASASAAMFTGAAAANLPAGNVAGLAAVAAAAAYLL